MTRIAIALAAIVGLIGLGPSASAQDIEHDEMVAVPMMETPTIDFDAVAARLDTACAGGDLVACRKRALIETNVRYDVAEARKLFRQACGKGDPESCYLLGGQFLNDDGTGQPGSAPDPKGSAAAYQRACTLGYAVACIARADLIRFDESAENDGEALPLFERACELGITTACQTAMETLQYNYELQAAQPGVADRLARTACDKNLAAGCSYVADLAEENVFAMPMNDTAREFRTRACALGYASDCERVLMDSIYRD